MKPLNLLELTPEFEARGVHLGGVAGFAADGWRENFNLALDAQPGLITAANAGIPAFLTTLIDPEVIETIFTPMVLQEVFGGEEKKGDWTTDAIEFPSVEPAGFTTSYGDWNNDGQVNTNVNWTPRQPYFYQVITQYGEREMARFGLTKLNLVAQLDISAAFVMNKFQNASYAFGINGLLNYGVLNDPNLISPIGPTPKLAGGTMWNTVGGLPNATAVEIYTDVLQLFTQLQLQMGGNADQNDEMLLLLSPGRAIALSRVSAFNITARQTIMENFPNLRIVAVPEYSTTAGEYMQMVIPRFRGLRTVIPAYPEKMRLFPVIPSLSGWQQKKAGGTWGSIIRRPICIAGMLGI